MKQAVGISELLATAQRNLTLRVRLPFVICGTALAFAVGLAAMTTVRAQAPVPSVDDALRGPFVSDPTVVQALDCPNTDCNGPLNFGRLLNAREKRSRAGSSNPFNLPVASIVLRTIQDDLKEIRKSADATDGQLSPDFLTDEGSRVELVGIVNRMDRQFVKDPNLHLSPEQLRCGELSLIYRFSYSIRDGKQKSRLPVTMNIVLPSLPFDNKGGVLTCQAMAQRWLDEMAKPSDRTPAQTVSDLLNAKSGPLAFVVGQDILRLELNMQVYRKSAQADPSKFGTEAAYLMRVFKWDDKTRIFLPEILRNQIDRGKITCIDGAPDCEQTKRRRAALVAFLLKKDTLSAIDKGTLEIDYGLGVLADRAISVSPGGSHRSLNQPYWNAVDPSQAIITDDEIRRAFDSAKLNQVKFSFMKSVEDFRTRLNESTCSGCHQTRAIAGFHFPGADRIDTPAVNSVFLPGSPHFYGDQLRRMEILGKMASQKNTRLKEYELSSSYSARPMNRFAGRLAGTQLIGGWGGACLTGSVRDNSQRQWDCRDDYVCRRLFESDNDPGVGTCVPKDRTEIGDALQEGEVKTTAFAKDEYIRRKPATTDARIPASSLPQSPPAGNSYYGAHQEFYKGDISSSDRVVRRDALTGGFPAGMLRL